MRIAVFVSTLILSLLLTFVAQAQIQIQEFSKQGRTHIDPTVLSNLKENDNPVGAFINYKATGVPNGVFAKIRCPKSRDGSPVDNYFSYYVTTIDPQTKKVLSVEPKAYFIPPSEDNEYKNRYISTINCDVIKADASFKKPNQIIEHCKPFRHLEVQLCHRNPAYKKDPQNPGQPCVDFNRNAAKDQAIHRGLTRVKVRRLRARAEQCYRENKKSVPHRSPLHIYAERLKNKITSNVFADLQDKSVCPLPNKKISLEGADWEDRSYNTQIYAADSGFFIGDKTHMGNPEPRHKVFFDYKKNKWHHLMVADTPGVLPLPISDKLKPGSTNTTIPQTLPIRYCLDPVSKNKKTNPCEKTNNYAYKGAIVLGITDGKPYAKIVSLKKGTSEIDRTKPFVNVSLSNTTDRKTTFESFKNHDPSEKGLRRFTISNSYKLGGGLTPGQKCTTDPNTCLRPYSDNPDTSKLCSRKQDTPISLSPLGDEEKELCYSCNGITPGACSDEKQIVSESNFKSIDGKLNSCSRPGSLKPGAPVIDISPRVNQ